MIDLRPTILAKSDQLNADDLIGGPMTITITDVRLLDAADQPVAVHWEGGEGRPFKPCKSMRRVMAKVWGEDGKAFIGQRMTVYRDDKVRFGSDAVGGIRISHMSGIDRETTMALMVTRGKRAPYTVRPLPSAPAGRSGTPDVDLKTILSEGRAAASHGSTALTAWWSELSRAEKAAAKPTLDDELKAAASAADQAALGAEDETPFDDDTGEIIESHLAGHDDEPDDDFPGDRPSTTSSATERPQGSNAISWGKDFLTWIPTTNAKALTEAWAEAKREGKSAALQHADPDLFDAIIEAKDRRFDALKGAR